MHKYKSIPRSYQLFVARFYVSTVQGILISQLKNQTRKRFIG